MSYLRIKANDKIQATIGGDIFQIETETPYPDDYQETAYGVAKEQHEKGIRPKLKNNGDVRDYDLIFLGTPVWWYTMASAVESFLVEHNFTGKTIIPFITHGGGGEYSIAEDIKALAKDAAVKPPFVVYGASDSSLDASLDKWLKDNLEK